MKREEIMDLITGLAHSTGWYGPIYEAIMNMSPDEKDEYLTELEELNFKNELDFILWYEERRRL